MSRNCSFVNGLTGSCCIISPLERGAKEGDSPVHEYRVPACQHVLPIQRVRLFGSTA